jgi:hypothetical protein
LPWWFGVSTGRTAVGGGGLSPGYPGRTIGIMLEPMCLVKVLAAYLWMDSRIGQCEWRWIVVGLVYREWGKNEDCEMIWAIASVVVGETLHKVAGNILLWMTRGGQHQ